MSRRMSTTLNTIFIHVVPLLLPYIISPVDHTGKVLRVQTRPWLGFDLAPVFILKLCFGLVIRIKVLLIPPVPLKLPMVVIQINFSSKPCFLELILDLEVVWHNVWIIIIQLPTLQCRDYTRCLLHPSYIPQLGHHLYFMVGIQLVV